MLFGLKFWAGCYIFIYTHRWKLICSLGIHGSSSLLFMMKLMVWHIVEWRLWGHDCTLSSATFKVLFFSFFLKFHEYGCMSCHWYFDWIMWVCATVSQGMQWSQISHATCKVEFTWREVCTSRATSGCVLFCISWELCFLWLNPSSYAPVCEFYALGWWLSMVYNQQAEKLLLVGILIVILGKLRW
jgi:hypothetical protein